MSNPSRTDWLAACTYGLGVHWTAQTSPRQGKPLPFQKAVEQFNLPVFMEAVDRSGADYVLFTAAHALQKLPCPSAVLDSILPERTAQRDLLGELADALISRNKSLIVYYNHSCNQGDDPPWEQAVGYHEDSKERFVGNLCALVGELGERYGSKIRAWWFDSAYSLDPRGPHNTITTEMKGFLFPWEHFVDAARAGFSDRLIAINAGIGETFLYTSQQDYWTGEMIDLKTPPTGRFLPDGRQWHGWLCLDDRAWVYTHNTTEPHLPLYDDEALVNFLQHCRHHQAPLTFNTIIFQDGSLAPASIDQIHRLKQRLGGK